MVRNAKIFNGVKLGGLVPLLDKSVFYWVGCVCVCGGYINMISGNAYAVNVLGVMWRNFGGGWEFRRGRKAKWGRYGDFARGRYVNFSIWGFIAFLGNLRKRSPRL